MRLRWILTSWIFFMCLGGILGQVMLSIRGKSVPELRREASQKILSPPMKITPSKFTPESSAFLKRVPPPLSLVINKDLATPTVYSYDALGLFCKFEVQLERMTHFPVKLRLGEVQYVDWLEGKRLTDFLDQR